MHQKKILIPAVILVLYAGAELYFQFTGASLERKVAGASILKVGEPVSRPGVYIARGRLAATTPARASAPEHEAGDYLALHYKVEVFQRHESSHMPGGHNTRTYSYRDLYSETLAEPFSNKKAANPNPRRWPLPNKSAFVMGSGFVFKNELRLDEKELARKWELFKGRYLLDAVDFTPPAVEGKTARRLRRGIYKLESVPGKTTIGDVRLTLKGLRSGNRVLVGEFTGDNRFSPFANPADGNRLYYFYYSTHWSDAQLREKLGALIVGGFGFYRWAMRFIFAAILVGVGWSLFRC